MTFLRISYLPAMMKKKLGNYGGNCCCTLEQATVLIDDTTQHIVSSDFENMKAEHEDDFSNHKYVVCNYLV